MRVSKKFYDEAIKVTDALEMTLEVKVSNFTDNKLKVEAINHYWDKSYYAFWDGNKIDSYSPEYVSRVKWILEQLKINPKSLKAGMRIYKRVPVKLS